MMFFRFGSAVLLVVLISLAGIALEKQTLDLKRSVSRQHYRLEILRDAFAKMRLKTQNLGAPTRLMNPLEQGGLAVRQPEKPVQPNSKRPRLLQWQRSAPYSR